MGWQRTVMFVHAHPDDETTKGGGLAAWLAAEGVRTLLVTCTDGGAGDVTDAELLQGRPLAEVRSEELAAAAAVMGFAAVHELGFHDSGVEAEIETGFATMAIDRAVDAVLELIEQQQPDVVVTYDPDYAKGHPDHLRCHDVSAAAFTQASARTGGPQKLYGTRFLSRARVQAMHDWMVETELKSPYERALSQIGDEPFTTRIAIAHHAVTALNGLREHRTQIAHDHRWFYSIPDEAVASLYPWEDLELLAVAPGITVPTTLETDLFAGLDEARPRG